jgi:hypothetical protein
LLFVCAWAPVPSRHTKAKEVAKDATSEAAGCSVMIFM